MQHGESIAYLYANKTFRCYQSDDETVTATEMRKCLIHIWYDKFKKSLCLIKHRAMAKLIGMEVQLHTLLTSAQEGESETLSPGEYPPVLFGKETRGAQQPVQTLWRKKDFFPLPRFELVFVDSLDRRSILHRPSYLSTCPQKKKKKLREQTMPTERPPLVGEVSANFCG
jgi:hypothetical protein